jgi:hypothetical protein
LELKVCYIILLQKIARIHIMIEENKSNKYILLGLVK